MKTECGAAVIELEIAIAATPAAVWKALVHDIGKWWLPDFHTHEASQGMTLEAKLGGRLYEDYGDGNGLVWYTVTGLEAGKSLLLVGHLNADYGGPAMTILHLKLEPQGSGTLMRISDSLVGRLGDGKLQQTKDGWQMLFEDGLKKYVEGEPNTMCN